MKIWELVWLIQAFSVLPLISKIVIDAVYEKLSKPVLFTTLNTNDLMLIIDATNRMLNLLLELELILQSHLGCT